MGMYIFELYQQEDRLSILFRLKGLFVEVVYWYTQLLLKHSYWYFHWYKER